MDDGFLAGLAFIAEQLRFLVCLYVFQPTPVFYNFNYGMRVVGLVKREFCDALDFSVEGSSQINFYFKPKSLILAQNERWRQA